jgi:tol-pal system protein YbgF
MKFKVLVLVVLLGSLNSAWAQSNDLAMYNRVQMLQQEILSLRDEIEFLRRDIDRLENRNRDFYQDLDRRLLELEQKGVIAKDEQAIKLPAESLAASEKLYNDAFDLLMNGSYDQAQQLLQQLIQKFPQDPLIPNAWYWVGEAYYVQAKFKEALTAFETVSQQYPTANKESDALLKQGYCLLELGEVQRAVQRLKAVRERYPKSQADQLAAQKLRELKQ